jgi:signal transduction histidine kinase
MTLTLRHRILLTLLPLLVLLAVQGIAGVLLLSDLGGRIDLILRENYESVVAMERLNEALERIDSSFQFALAGRQDSAMHQYRDNWKAYEAALHTEEDNITLPGERELVERLVEETTAYRRQGDAFYRLMPNHPERQQAYFGQGGLLDRFKVIKDVSYRILVLNQDNMKEASRDARQTAASSLVALVAGLVVAVILAGVAAWRMIRTILQPIRAITQAATGIGAGNLDQLVSYSARDELGELAEQFNRMARRLRDYRFSHSAQLLRAQRTSQATINSFPDPVLVVDTEGLVEMANPAAQRLFGVVPKKASQPPAPPWQPPEPLRSPLTEALHGQRDYRPSEFDHAVSLNSDGSQGSYLPRILTIHDPYGSPLGAAVLLQDVTRFRFLDQVKSDLVATASHELKTPLTSLRLDVHLLLEESVGPLTAKQTELLLDARDSAERLLAIVENLLNLARLEERRAQLERQPVAPGTLLRAALDAIRPRAEDKGLDLVIEPGDELPPLTVDADQLGHALGNLLDNAVAYTDRGGRITLAAARTADAVVLSVSDTGVGIPPEHLPHVFDRFFRVPGQSRGQGTGLGLAIARETVAAQGGTLSCESTPGVGTTFRLSFPLTAAEAGLAVH